MTQHLPPDDHPAAVQGAPGGAVLDLHSFGADRPARIVAGLRTYWQRLCAGRAVPERSDITAEGLGPALDYAFILERIAPGSARLRQAGRHLIDLMGMEVRGMPVSALLNPGHRGRLSDVLESVFQGPQVAELGLVSPQCALGAAFPARMLLMPLKSDLGDVTRILGCLVSAGQPGRLPRRFDLTDERFEPVIPGAAVLEPGQEPEPAGRRRLRAQLEARDFDLRQQKCAPDMGEKAARRRRALRTMLPAPGAAGSDAATGAVTDAAPPAPDAAPRGIPGWRPRLIVDNDR